MENTSDTTTLEKILNLGGIDPSKINVGNPIKILTFDTSNPKFVLGCYILGHPEIIDEFRKCYIINYGHIDEYDILFFQPSHLYDLANVYYGLLYSIHIQNKINIIDLILDYLTTLANYPTYNDIIGYNSKINFVDYKLEEDEAKIVQNALRYIPFLTYAQLDYFSNIAINILLKELDEKNESNPRGSENTESA